MAFMFNNFTLGYTNKMMSNCNSKDWHSATHSFLKNFALYFFGSWVNYEFEATNAYPIFHIVDDNLALTPCTS